MKTILIALLAFSISGVTLGTEKEKHVESEVKAVTVYLQGAQIQRTAKIYVEKGITKLIFDNVTQYFNKNNIQVKGIGSFIILDVAHNIYYPVPEKVAPTGTIPLEILREIKRIEDSLVLSGWNLKSLQSKLEVYTSEKKILLNSGVIKGQEQNDSIPLLKDAMTYFRIKLIEINKLTLEMDHQISKENIVVQKLNTRLSELRNWQNSTQKPIQNLAPVQQIIVTVSADASASGSITLNYTTTQAGWSPSYDLRADNVGAPVNITYKAKVFQNTGVDWDNVDITLSTIDPNRSNEKPVLAPWYINYYQAIQPVGGADNYYNNMGVGQQSKAMPSMSGEMKEDEVAQHISNYTEMQTNMTMVEFKLKIAHSIPSDNKEHLMAVASKSIPATFEYFAAPKIEREAFLIAKLTGWEDLNLLPAIANIFYDGTYVGQTRIEPSSIRDTMELALGRDPRVIVERKRLDFDEIIKKISGEKIATISYNITAKNLNLASLKLNILDHIPLALDQEIKVELIDNGGGDFNETKGFLKWVFTLESKASKKINYSYSVRYNKDKQVIL